MALARWDESAPTVPSGFDPQIELTIAQYNVERQIDAPLLTQIKRKDKAPCLPVDDMTDEGTPLWVRTESQRGCATPWEMRSGTSEGDSLGSKDDGCTR